MKLPAGTVVFFSDTDRVLETCLQTETETFRVELDVLISNLNSETKKNLPHLNIDALCNPLRSVNKIHTFSALKNLCKQGYTKYLFQDIQSSLKTLNEKEEPFFILVYRNGELIGCLKQTDLFFVF